MSQPDLLPSHTRYPPDDERTVKTIFQQLKPICITLLQAQTLRRKQSLQYADGSGSTRNNDQQYSILAAHSTDIIVSALETLQHLIISLPPYGVYKCFDYIVFPLAQCLTPLRDTAVAASVLPTEGDANSTAVQSSETITTLALQVLHQLLITCCSTSHMLSIVCNYQSVNGLLQLLVHYIAPPKAQQASESGHLQKSDYSEEVQLLTCNALHTLFSSVDEQLAVPTHGLAADRQQQQQQLTTYLRSDDFVLTVGYLLSRLLYIVRHERHRPLRIRALQTIEVVYHVYMQPTLIALHTAHRTKLQSELLGYLPGTLSALYRIVNGDFKAGSRVIAQAVQTFTSVLLYAVDDTILNKTVYAGKQQASEFVQSRLSNLQSLINKQQGTDTVKRELLEADNGIDVDTSPTPATRTTEWLKLTTSQTSKLLYRMFSASYTERHTRIESALIRSASTLLQHCNVALNDEVRSIICDYLMSNTQHTDSALRHEAEHAVKQLTHIRLPYVDRLRHHLFAFPRIARSAAANPQLAHIRLLTAYTQYAQSGAVKLLSSEFGRLFQCIAEAIKIDVSDTRVLESQQTSTSELSPHDNSSTVTITEHDDDTSMQASQFTTADEASRFLDYDTELKRDEAADAMVDSFFGPSTDVGTKYRNQTSAPFTEPPAQPPVASLPAVTPRTAATYYATHFLYLRDEAVQHAVHTLFQAIGSIAADNIQLLLDPLIDIIIEPHIVTYRNEALWLCNQLVSGVGQVTTITPDVQPAETTALQLLLNEYISPQLWQQIAMINPQTGAELVDGSVTAALIIRGIGDVACSLGAEGFQPYVMFTIYPLLDLLGSGSTIVSQAAAATIQRITTVLGLQTPSQVIVENADYIVDNIAQQLRQFQRSHSRSDGNAVVVSSSIPHVLRAMLTRIPDMNVTALLPYLQDVLDSVLQTLAVYVEQVDDDGREAQLGGGLTRTQYMQIVALVTNAIRSASDSQVTTEQLPRPQSTFYAASAIINPQEAAVHYQPSSIRQRIQQLIEQQHKHNADTLAERQWMQQQLADAQSNPNITQEWYEEVQAKKRAEEESKYNGDAAMNAEADSTSKVMNSDEDEQLDIQQKLALNILQRCRHFLASPSIELQVLVLQIIGDAVTILQSKPKTLLPVVAKFWPAFRNRLSLQQQSASAYSSQTPTPRTRLAITPTATAALLQQQSSNEITSDFSQLAPTVVRRLVDTQAAEPTITSITSLSTSRYTVVFVQAMHIVNVLSQSTGRFLASRFSSDVWPVVKQLLQDESRSESDSWRASSNEKHTPTVKVVISMLHTLTTLVHQPDLLYKLLSDIATTCLPYLSNRMPAVIQSASTQLYVTMVQLDADVTHTAILTLCTTDNAETTDEPLPTPNHRFVPVLASVSAVEDLNNGIYNLLHSTNPYTNLLPQFAQLSASQVQPLPRSEYASNVTQVLQRLHQQSEAQVALG